MCLGKAQAKSTEKPLIIAVAANFKPTLEDLIKAYKVEVTQANIQISSASSGVLYAQILRGAPFDLFLSADSERPNLLQQQGLIEVDTLVTYALGQLVLLAPGFNQLDQDKLKRFSGKIALANPKLAPFGRASKQSLKSLGLWDDKRTNLIMANNVSQVAQMVKIGAVPMGLLSKSLLENSDLEHSWQLPDKYYQPIVQQMVILKKSGDTALHKQRAINFYQYIISPKGQAIISHKGYRLPKLTEINESLSHGR